MEEQQLIKVERRVDKADGMDDCFGFGEEEEDEEEPSDQVMDHKGRIITSDSN